MSRSKSPLVIMAFTLIGLVSAYWISMYPIMKTDLVSDDPLTVSLCIFFIIIGLIMSAMCYLTLTGIKDAWDYAVWLDKCKERRE